MKLSSLSPSSDTAFVLKHKSAPSEAVQPPSTEPTDTLVKSAKHPPVMAPPKPTPPDRAGEPERIVIIRHGEKPDDGAPGQDPAGLTPQGEARAQALATVLPKRYPDIDYLFAADSSDNSHRPLDTVTPLANKLGLPVNSSFKDKQFGALAQTLESPQYAGKTIVVGWHHGEIPQLATALGVTPPETKWPSNSFDRIWEVDIPAGGGKPTIQDLPEEALPGDSTD